MGSGMHVVGRPLVPLGFEHLNLDNVTPQGLTVPAGGGAAIIQAEDNPVRWRADGTNPAAGTGMVLDVVPEFLFFENSTFTLETIKFISTLAGGSGLNVHYFQFV